MQESFDKQQREMRKNFERMLKQQQKQIDALKKQVTTATNTPTATPKTNQTTIQTQIDKLNEKTNILIKTTKKIQPNKFNPTINLINETIFSTHTHSSQQTKNNHPKKFDVFQRSIELNIAATVDPFAKGYAVINA